jgi:hypothetical protein
MSARLQARRPVVPVQQLRRSNLRLGWSIQTSEVGLWKIKAVERVVRIY